MLFALLCAAHDWSLQCTASNIKKESSTWGDQSKLDFSIQFASILSEFYRMVSLITFTSCLQKLTHCTQRLVGLHLLSKVLAWNILALGYPPTGCPPTKSTESVSDWIIVFKRGRGWTVLMLTISLITISTLSIKKTWNLNIAVDNFSNIQYFYIFPFTCYSYFLFITPMSQYL